MGLMQIPGVHRDDGGDRTSQSQDEGGSGQVLAKGRTGVSILPNLLRDSYQSLPTRQFLLTNALTSPGPDAHIVFRVPLTILSKAIPSIGEFPYDPANSPPTWSGPTLFLKGAKSKYINRRNIPVAEQFFPKSRLEILDAGHWVHAEQPIETVRLVKEFLQGIGETA